MKRRVILLSGEGGYCQTAAVRLDPGQVIDALPDYAARFGHAEFLAVLERFRPAGMLGHHDSVVMNGSVEDLDNTGGGEWLHELRVAPGTVIERHDAAWANEVAMLVADEATRIDDASLRRAAENYWHGVASDSPQWEYFAGQAVIVAVHDY